MTPFQKKAVLLQLVKRVFFTKNGIFSFKFTR